MARAKPWLKLWAEWIHDPKMLALTLAEQGAWWRLVTLAASCGAEGKLVTGNDIPLTFPEIANCLHITSTEDMDVLKSMVAKMELKGSLNWNSDILTVTHLVERQAKVASETTEALRERQQKRRQNLWDQYGIKDSSIPKETRRLVIERDECRCQLCGKQGMLSSPEATVVLDPEDNSPFEFDHIILKSQGGSDDPDNLRLSCRKCNRARGTQPSPPPLRTPPPKDKDKDKEEEEEQRRVRDKSVTNLQDALCAEISNLYEENIGSIKPALADEIKDFCENFRGPVPWIKLAFKEALSRNKKRWQYIRTILENWQEEGGPDDTTRGQPFRGKGARTDTHKRDSRWTDIGDEPSEATEEG